MVLYTKDGDKVKCIKLKQPPKINSKNDYWDNFERNINDQKVKFWFTVKKIDVISILCSRVDGIKQICVV